MGCLCQTFRQEKDWKVKGITKSLNISVKNNLEKIWKLKDADQVYMCFLEYLLINIYLLDEFFNMNPSKDPLRLDLKLCVLNSDDFSIYLFIRQIILIF